MKILSKISKAALAFIFIHAAFAVNIQQFQRSNSLTFEKLEDGRLTNSHVHSDYDMIFVLGGSWVDAPSYGKKTPGNNQLDEIIKGAWAAHLGFGYYFTEDLMFGATTSYTWLDSIYQANEEGFSDIELKLKWRFLEGENTLFLLFLC